MGVPRGRAAAVAAMVFAAVWTLRGYLRLPAAWPLGGQGWTALADLAAAATAAVLCAGAVRRAGNGRARVAWCCQSAACGLWAAFPLAASPLAASLLVASPLRSWTVVADVGRAGFLACAAVGAWLTFRGPDPRARLRMALDAAVGASAMFIVAWALLFARIWEHQQLNRVALAVSVAYPVGAMVLLIFFVLLRVTEFRPGPGQMLVRYDLGLMGILLADIRFAQLHAIAGSPPRLVDTGGWVVGFALLGAAARSYGGTTHRRSLPTTTRWIAYLPYQMLVVAIVTIIAQVAIRRSVPVPELVACALIVAAVLVRQMLLLAENRTLVAQLAASEAELRHQALHDSLTGLGNRVLLVDRLQVALAERRDGGPTVMFCDLDDFKVVNDTLGHHAGDELLTLVAERLRRAVRPGDTVIRLGGDEFAVLLECVEADAIDIARRVWNSFQRPFVVCGQAMTLGASIGLASCGAGAGPHTAGELLKAADIAMYEAKRRGKNGVELFTLA